MLNVVLLVFFVSCSFYFYSSLPQHIEECCGWLRQKLSDLNKEQLHIIQQHQEQVGYHADLLPMAFIWDRVLSVYFFIQGLDVL